MGEAKGMTELMLTEKRKKLKKEGKDTRLEEDDPLKYRRAVYVMTMKLFADMERKRRELEQRDMEERKRKWTKNGRRISKNHVKDVSVAGKIFRPQKLKNPKDFSSHPKTNRSPETNILHFSVF